MEITSFGVRGRAGSVSRALTASPTNFDDPNICPRYLTKKESQMADFFEKNWFVQIMFQGAGLKCSKQKRWQLEWDLSTRAAIGVQINFPALDVPI